MKEYLIGSDNGTLLLLVILNIVLTAGMLYLFYKILRSGSPIGNDYPLP